MITVAVTGGIGSGKSTVSGAFGDLGAVVIDSDRLARDAVAPGTSGVAAIAAAFGRGLLTTDGALDRPALARLIFSDPGARATVEGIVHPLVRAEFDRLREQAPAEAVVVNDIPLLVTMAAAASYHLVVGVRADPELRIRRLIARGLTEDDARARMAAQLTDAARAPLCDVVQVNDGELTELVAAAKKLWADRLVPFESNTRLGHPAVGHVAASPPEVNHDAAVRRLAARVSAAAGNVEVRPVDRTDRAAAPAASPARARVDLGLVLHDPAAYGPLVTPLTAAGFPRVDSSPTGLVDDADRSRGVLAVHANADPGQTLNLYVTVR